MSNQVRDPAKIDRLARLPRYGARIVVCIDDLANVAELSGAAQKHGTTLECFVEIDCGADRCGVCADSPGRHQRYTAYDADSNGLCTAVNFSGQLSAELRVR